MTANGESGALFTADGDLVLHDQLADVLESDRGLVEFDLVLRRQRVDHVGGDHGLGHTILPTAAFHDVIKEHGDDVIGRDEGAIVIHDAEAVGVTVACNPDARR